MRNLFHLLPQFTASAESYFGAENYVIFCQYSYRSKMRALISQAGYTLTQAPHALRQTKGSECVSGTAGRLKSAFVQ